MAHLSAWMGAGAVAAGVSAALIAGADVASADTTGGADTASASAQDASDRSDTSDAKARDEARESAKNETADGTADVDQPDDDTPVDDPDEADEEASDDDTEGTGEDAEGADPADEPEDPASPEPAVISDDVLDGDVLSDDVDQATPPTEGVTEEATTEEPADAEPSAPVEKSTTTPADVRATAKTTVLSSAATPTAAGPQLPVLPDLVQSFLFDFIGVAVTFIAGPPVVPRGSTVTVRTSTLEITEGRNVPAHWYFPEGDEPPQRIIYLQHGFLGVGAMYSYTAANLAETTNSIVVLPTLTSNRFVADGFWLGSDQALRATADLLLGDRDALTASAIAAGYAQRYGAGVALPGRFALVGHSLGGNLVAGTAGYYADAVTASGATNQLAGVVLLDAAPQLNVLTDALDKLDSLDTYIPVLELGAPKESRRVDAALNEHRPGKFNGVVLENGKHLDSMQGGTWLIQLISHLYQGFPTAQNQAAAQTLIDGWVGDILDGRIDPATGRCDGDECAGIYGDLGETLLLETPVGPTSGTVIGVPLPARSAEFQPWSATTVVTPRPPVGSGLLLRV